MDAQVIKKSFIYLSLKHEQVNLSFTDYVFYYFLTHMYAELPIPLPPKQIHNLLYIELPQCSMGYSL